MTGFGQGVTKEGPTYNIYTVVYRETRARLPHFLENFEYEYKGKN